MSFTKRRKTALEWLEHLYSVDEQNRLAAEAGLNPGNPEADLSKIPDPGVRAVYTGVREKQQPYPYNFATPAQYDSILSNTILYLQGKWSVDKLLAQWDAVDKQFEEKQGALRNARSLLFVLPALMVLAGVFVVPIGQTLLYSLTDCCFRQPRRCS